MSETSEIYKCKLILAVAREKLGNIEYTVSSMKDELEKITAFLGRLEITLEPKLPEDCN